MATRNIIDLSQPITPASPAPCDPPVEFRTVASHGPDSPYQMMWFGMTDHTARTSMRLCISSPAGSHR